MTYFGDRIDFGDRIERTVPSSTEESQGFDLVLDAGGSGPVEVPDLAALLQGTYDRIGSDLLITSPDGTRILLTDYFAAAHAVADLTGPDGAVLKASVVSALAGPGPAATRSRKRTASPRRRPSARLRAQPAKSSPRALTAAAFSYNQATASIKAMFWKPAVTALSASSSLTKRSSAWAPTGAWCWTK